VCRPLRDSLGNDEAWFDAWRAEGELQQTRAREADEHGRRITAGAAYLRACNYFQTLRVFTTEEGGSQHCQRDYMTHGTSVMYDWLAEKL
jgi:hypothetical protein